MPGVGGVEVLPGESHYGVVAVVGVVGVPHEFDGGEHQEGTEQIEDPGELLNRHRTQRDEYAAEDQRQHDAHHQRLLLIDLGHLEAGHDDDENEQVVHRQAVLGEPPGEEFQAVLTAVDPPHPHSE